MLPEVIKIDEIKNTVEPTQLYGYGVVGKGVVELWESILPGYQLMDVHVKSQEVCNIPLAGDWIQNGQEVDETGCVIDVLADTNKSVQLLNGLTQSEELQVISASKDAIAKTIPLKNQKGQLRYEAAVCGSIPIITLLDEYYGFHQPQKIQGILNGSSNYVLDLVNSGETLTSAISKAQKAGFAEADPTVDIDGTDAANKLSILIYHAFGIKVQPNQIPKNGINSIPDHVFHWAQINGYKIKLIAQAILEDGVVSGFVWPCFVRPKSPLFNVHAEYNGVLVETADLGTQFLSGKGAGKLPTAGAIGLDGRKLKQGQYYALPRSEVKKWEPKVNLEWIILERNGLSSNQYIDQTDFNSLTNKWNTQGSFGLPLINE